MNRDVPKILIIFGILVGLIFYLVPIFNKISNGYYDNYKNFDRTTGKFVEYSLAGKDENDNQLYKFVFIYTVNGHEYSYVTNETSLNIPKKDSKLTILYNINNPNISVSELYDDTLLIFNLFQIMGEVFIFLSLFILFFYNAWIRDLIVFISTSNLIYFIVKLHIYNTGVLFLLLILATMFLKAIMEFIIIVKNHKFHPIKDVKEEIAISKAKKQTNQNISQKYIYLKKKRKTKIIKGVFLLFAPPPIYIIIDINFSFINIFISYICIIFVTICMFYGFFLIAFAIIEQYKIDNNI